MYNINLEYIFWYSKIGVLLYNIKLWDVGPVKSVGYGHNIIEESICGPWDTLNQYTLVYGTNQINKIWLSLLYRLFVGHGTLSLSSLHFVYCI